MTTETARQGDTFARIARRVYGDDRQSQQLRSANPGVTEPISEGTRVRVPPPRAQDVPQPIPADSVDEVALLLDGTRFRYWTSVTITRSIDSPDTVSFSAPWNPESSELREAFRPFSFKSMAVTVGGSPLFSGTLVAVEPDLSSNAYSVEASGYSLSGVLDDVTMPSSAWPVEYSGLTLQQIASEVCKPFGLFPVFSASPGAVFEQVSMRAGQSVMRFLADLAGQRGLVIGADRQGQPVFKAPAPGLPVARLMQGEPPILSVVPTFSPQSYYSHVTAHEPTRTGKEGQTHTAKNPYAGDQLRPHVFEVRDAEGGDVPKAAEAKLGRMYGNVVSWDVEIMGWTTPDGSQWAPGQTVSIKAPGAMIYRETQMMIRSVDLDRTGDSQTAILTLTLPSVWTGELPGELPWDG